jgi:hypothetical protein
MREVHKIAVNPFSDPFAEIDVKFFHTSLFGIPAWGICAAAALIVGGILLKVFWPTKSPRKARRAWFGDSGAVRDFMSTVRLSDTQRIDRLHRVIKLTVGEKVDLNDLSFGRMSKLAVTFKGVEHSHGQDFAHIKLELGGAAAECGKSVEELGENDFLVPRAAPNDQRCFIHYTSGKGDTVSFLQIKVQKIDSVERSTAIDILHLRGRQAA